VERVYFVCRACRLGVYAADERLGIEGAHSRQAERLLCLAGASWSFDAAAVHLKTLTGISVADNTIRNICDGRAAAISRWRHTESTAHESFREAEGSVEFETDGTCVNTYDGWREMRVGIFAKRTAGQPATPEEWGDRRLPPVAARTAFAAIEKAERFRTRWPRWKGRLGIKPNETIHAVADGARWIWDALLSEFRHVEGVLDVYHALEHLAQAARVIYGEGTSEAQRWLDAARREMLSGGWPALHQHLSNSYAETRSAPKRKALRQVTQYFRRHEDHLNYAQHLAAGRTIGSGMVEGACKNVIGRRLKQTGARWRTRRANRMAILCSTLYSDHWDQYWASA
jgi:hypothetical protein